MKKFAVIVMLFLASFLVLSSCATIFTGTKDRIYFTSNPSGVKVYKDGLLLGTTPFDTKLKRSISDVDVEFKLDGYQTRVVTLSRSFNAIAILNLFDVIGWGIDLATGSLFKYDRKSYNVEMEKAAKMTAQGTREIHIDTEKKVVEVCVMAD